MISNSKRDTKRLSHQLKFILNEGNRSKKHVRIPSDNNLDTIQPLCNGFFSKRSSVVEDKEKIQRKNEIIVKKRTPSLRESEVINKKINLCKVFSKKIIGRENSSKKKIVISNGNTAEYSTASGSFRKHNDAINHEREKIMQYNKLCIVFNKYRLRKI